MTSRQGPPTWAAMMDQWAAHEVPFVAVIEPDRTAKRLPERWVNPDGTPCDYLFTNPVAATGRHLAEGIVTRNPVTFAAFALHAFFVDEGVDRQNNVAAQVAKRMLEGADTRAGWYWYATAKHVLPWGGGRRFDEQRTQEWPAWIDAAAQRWLRIASEYAVMREIKF